MRPGGRACVRLVQEPGCGWESGERKPGDSGSLAGLGKCQVPFTSGNPAAAISLPHFYDHIR